jgi:isopenicillin-N epimerase
MHRRDLLKFFGSVAALPSDSLFRSNPEAYWTQLRKEQFLLPDWRHFLNNGSLGVTPKPVLKSVTDYMERAAALLMDDYPRWGYETLDAERAKMAAFVGCKPSELAFTHNATEAISIVAAGVDLKPGDEVLMTDFEHPSGKNPWFLKAQRYGVTVREVKLPVPPKSASQLADVFTSAIGPRTRMISFSGIVSGLGFLMPSREICDYARSKGILTLVDGAHMHGQVPVKISDLHCDFFAGSPHKWLFAPAGCGILYAREEVQDRLWPSIVTGNWDNKKLGAARFMQVGTNNRAIFEGMMAGLDFHNQIGSERVYSRIHDLSKTVYRRAAEVPYLKMLSPEDDTMWGGLVSFEITKDTSALWPKLKEKKVWTTGGNRMRMSTHVHTRPEDIEVFFGILKETLG